LIFTVKDPKLIMNMSQCNNCC